MLSSSVYMDFTAFTVLISILNAAGTLVLMYGSGIVRRSESYAFTVGMISFSMHIIMGFIGYWYGWSTLPFLGLIFGDVLALVALKLMYSLNWSRTLHLWGSVVAAQALAAVVVLMIYVLIGTATLF
jgi:hypothetical protein